jgi:oligogalacturonide lyase
MVRSIHVLCTALFVAMVSGVHAQQPPKSWVDKDTGHRVFRLTDEPNSQSPYFNVNAYSPDGRLMMYTAPDGIHVLDLTTRKTRLLVRNPPMPAGSENNPMERFRHGVHAIVVGHKTPSVFYTQFDPETHAGTLYKADMYTGKITRLVELKPGESIITINADETLGAGTEDDGPPVAGSQSRPRGAQDERSAGMTRRESKGQMMERRLASRQPLILYTVDLRPGPDNGKMKILLHSTDWINHLLFSPSDPTLLMYCHEGPWQKVDRIWNIHTDGTHNTLIHKRTMAMEIAGHEFWGLDGRTIWYDWQYPKGQVFFLAGYNLETGKRVAYHMERNDWSIHFNVTQDESLFTGDGGDPGQVAHAPDGEWIELFHPQMISLNGALNSPDFWQPGVFHPEHLVNMAHHNYRLEPNVRFSPDKKMVIFRSNMFGPSYVFGVEVARATDVQAGEVHSTPELAAQFNPVQPTPTNVLPPAPSSH